MDLNTIRTVMRPTERDSLPCLREGDAWLAGGTWLFSEPQRGLGRLVDLAALGWLAIERREDALVLAATCTLAALDAHAADAAFAAAGTVRRCCRALWGSFKIWNMATVGGNLCLALPAAPMAALAVGFDARLEIWDASGGSRTVTAADFILGPRRTCLRPDELLRAIALPDAALGAPTAVRQASLLREGRSAALLLGRIEGAGLRLAITAAVPRPLALAFSDFPDRATLAEAIDAAASAEGWYNDLHGLPDWRRHMTLRLGEEVRQELENAR